MKYKYHVGYAYEDHVGNVGHGNICMLRDYPITSPEQVDLVRDYITEENGFMGVSIQSWQKYEPLPFFDKLKLLFVPQQTGGENE